MDSATMKKRNAELLQLKNRLVALLPEDDDEAAVVIESLKATALSRHDEPRFAPAMDYSDQKMLAAGRDLENEVCGLTLMAELVSLALGEADLRKDDGDPELLLFAIAEQQRQIERFKLAYYAALWPRKAALAA